MVKAKTLSLKSLADLHFTKNYSYVPAKDSKAELGEVFLSLEVLNTSKEQGESIGEAIFSNLKSVYYNNSGLSSYERFEEALKVINIEVQALRRQEKKSSRVNAIVAVLSNGELHLSQTGYSEAYLRRGSSFTLISEGLYLEDESTDLFQNIASGLLEKGDQVFFSTERLLRFTNPSDLVKIFSAKDLEYGLGELKDILKLENVENINLYAFELEENVASPVATPEPIAQAVSPIKSSIQNFARSLEEKGITQNTLLATVGAILVVLIVAVWLIGGSRSRQVDNAAVAKQVEQFELKINDTTNLYLNGEREIAANILNQVSADIDTVLTNPGDYRETLLNLKSKIIEQRNLIDSITPLENGNVITDLKAKKSDISAVGLVSLPDNIKYAFDSNALYRAIFNDVSNPFPFGPEAKIIDGAYFTDYRSMVFLDSNNRIAEFANDAITWPSAPDGAWKPAVALDTYSKFIYLLDPSEGETGQLWKYERTRTGYQRPTAYNINADLSNATDVAIDGSIWTLHSDGSVGKLFKGERQDVIVADAPSETPENATRLFTSAEAKNLYILDPARQRILSYFKEIQNPNQITYLEQYSYAHLGLEVQDLFVTNDELKMYLLTKDSIVEFAL